MKRGPHYKRKSNLDKDGVPKDQSDWTEKDWSDLWFGIKRIKARIRKRHLAIQGAKLVSDKNPTATRPAKEKSYE